MKIGENLDPLAELIRRCTVGISHRGNKGTGFFVAPGWILTCAHVLGESSALKQTVAFRWNKANYEGRLETLMPDPCPGDDIFPDLALISHSIANTECVFLGQGFKDGDRFYSWGYSDLRPGGESLSGVCDGEAAYDETPERRLIKFKDAQVLPGISGSPLLNRTTGAVCGIVKRTRGIDSNLGGLAVRIEWVFEQLLEIAASNKQFHEANREWRDALTSEHRSLEIYEPERLNRGPKFVDRETQEKEFKDFWLLASSSRPGAPLIYLVPAMDVDCPEYFVDRLHEDTVERLARSFKVAEKAAIDRVIVREPDSYSSLEAVQKDLSRELFIELGAIGHWNGSQPSAKPLAKLQRLRLPTFVIIEQTIRSDFASPFLRELLSWYFNSFWAEFRADSRILVFLHLKCPAPRNEHFLRFRVFRRPADPYSSYMELDQHLRQVLSDPDGQANIRPESSGAPVKRLSALPPIQLDDIKKWLEPLVLPHVIDKEAQRLFEDVRIERGPSIRLSYMYEVLDDYFYKHLTEKFRRNWQPGSTR